MSRFLVGLCAAYIRSAGCGPEFGQSRGTSLRPTSPPYLAPHTSTCSLPSLTWSFGRSCLVGAHNAALQSRNKFGPMGDFQVDNPSAIDADSIDALSKLSFSSSSIGIRDETEFWSKTRKDLIQPASDFPERNSSAPSLAVPTETQERTSQTNTETVLAELTASVRPLFLRDVSPSLC